MSEASKYGTQIAVSRAECRVIVDGKAHNVDTLGLPAYIRAIHFNFEKSSGHIEFVEDAKGNAMPNLSISDGRILDLVLQDWQAEESRSQKFAQLVQSGRIEQKDASTSLT